MGDTSSGKSSLLSAIAGNDIFPSNDSLTTRCPTRLRLESSSNPTNAKISIKWHNTSEYKQTFKPIETNSWDKIS